MYVVKEYRNADVLEAINIALKAKLYVPGWALQPYLSWLRRRGERSWVDVTIRLAFNGETPIGIGVRHIDGPYNPMCFVRPQYRRKGIGSKLVEGFSFDEYEEGIKGSDQFWRKVKHDQN